MQGGKVSDEDREIYDEILRLIRERKSMYGRARVTSALRLDNKTWKNVLTEFRILDKDDSGDCEKFFDYGDFQIRQTCIAIEDFIEIMERLINKAELAVPNCPLVMLEGSLKRDFISTYYYRPSNDVAFGLGWPTNVFMIRVASGNASPTSGPFVAFDQPLFDDGYSVIRAVFGIDAQHHSVYIGSVLFLIPNFRAKIAEVKVRSKQLGLKILAKNARSDEMVAKIYCETPPKIYQTEIQLTGNEINIPLEFTPDFYLIYLFSSKTKEVLDHRRFHLSWDDLTDDIKIEITPEYIEQIIAHGEGERVEFKLDVPKRWDEFAETVVAMSNSYGGTILVGVDDRGSIIGINNDSKIEDSINDSMRYHCEPPVELPMSKHLVQDKTILMVKIKTGDNKPYTLRNRGVFVRAGATDRIATRDELDTFYENKSKGYSEPGFWRPGTRLF